jgi:multidrug efflux system outer membrane protein
MARRGIVLAVACGALAGGCTLGPDYVRPPIDSPAAWRQAVAEAESLANVPWWELFEDDVLRQLIRTALEENRDLRIAIERIEEARARYGISKSELWPEVDVRGAGGALEFSEGSLTHTPEGTDNDNTTQLYDLSARVSWELDLFGRVRRSNQAELANLLATEEARRAVAITLVSEVARAYVELRDLDRRLEIARRTLTSRQEYVTLARDRFEGGVTPEVDFRQAEAEFHRVRSFVADLEKLVVQKENEISFLLGHSPGAVPRGRAVDEQPIPPQVPAGLPAALLEQRPDIREAEQRLVAANAQIGVAQADRFPRISLTGSFGVASTDLGELLDGDSVSWNLFGSIVQPIFNAGRNRRRVEVQESRTRQAVHQYERTVLQALREVEDSLISLEKSGDKRDAQGQRVGAERKVLELSELRYRGGVAAYLEVLDAQRSLFDAEIDEVASVSEQATSLIRLYRALGGGWPTASEPAEPEQAQAAAGGQPNP